MALFKVSKGLKANLPSAKTEGYCWYTTDDSLFYIDYKDENGSLQRKALNAKDAETLTGASLSTILNSSDVEIPTSKAVLNALNEKLDKADAGSDWNQNDATKPDYVKNRPFYESISLTTFLEEQQIDFSSSFTIPNDIVQGKTYFVHWDDAEYTIEATAKDIFGDGSIWIPYLEQADGLFTIEGSVMDAADKGIHNVAIYTTELSLKTIDEKFIPDTIARKDSVVRSVCGGYPDSNGNVNVNYDDLVGNKPTNIKDGSGKDSILQDTAQEASGRGSHAEGDVTIASGDYSHAEGTRSKARGTYSHAEGVECVSIGSGSHAEGFGTASSSNYQHVEGKFNIEDLDGKYANIVGNGDRSARSNAHTLDWSGNAWYSGTVEGKALILPSSTENSTKKFRITVDDDYNVSATNTSDSVSKILATTEYVDNSVSNPLNITSATVGQIAKISAVDDTGKPTTWETINIPTPFKPEGKYCLTFSSPNSFTLAVNDATKHWDGTLEYFASDRTWTVWDGANALSAVAYDGEYVLYLRGIGNTKIAGDSTNYKWVLSGTDIACIGNIENLLDYETVASGNHPTMADCCYANMFYGCTALIHAPALPATTMAINCYRSMFFGCTSLTKAPALPATTLADWCYAYMFRGCTSLTQAPALTATTLADYCYQQMFFDCTSLTQAPALPATTLAIQCYYSMFRNCTSLTQAPYLPATTLAQSCYVSMFYGCTALTQAPELPATTLVDGCYRSMFQGCTSLTQTPSLPATILATNCYSYMFCDCTGLKLSSSKTDEYTQEYRIPSSGTGTTATDALSNMFTNTGGNFMGAPEINTTYYLSSDNMIVRDTEIATLNGYVGSMIDGVTPSTLGLNKSVLFKSVEVVLPTSANWYSVTFGNNRFVAVANNSNIAAYSDDGITWTQTTLPTSANWSSVTFGNNRFVVVANNSNIAAYSDDGITWTQTTLSSSAKWRSVTFGNNRFVAVANNSTVAAYSDDGITWTQTTLPGSAIWQSVAFGNNRFVAVPLNHNIAAYSDDGITWAQTTLPGSLGWSSVTFGNNRFVIVSNNSSIAAYSDDGITWTQTTLPTSTAWSSVIFGNNWFVAVAYNTNIAAYSDDGITWAQTTLPVSANWNLVTFGNNRFVAISKNSTVAVYSDDGINWYNTADILTYPDNTDIKDRIKSVLGITQSVSIEEVASMIDAAIGNAIGGSY